MRFAVIVSAKDPAGISIKEALMRRHDFKSAGKEFEGSNVYSFQNLSLYTTGAESIHCEDIDKKIDADIFVFATKHESRSGIPSLSAHAAGNWGNDKSYGGKEKALCIAPADYLKSALIFLEENNKTDFEVVQECTHHGPYLEKPVMFIEIGSSEKQWKNLDAAETIANAIVHIGIEQPQPVKTAFGIGGLHTTPSFRKIMLKTDIAVGHVCPKHNLENLDGNLMLEAVRKTAPAPADIVILDWKGLGREKERIVRLLNELKIPFSKTSAF